MKYLKYFENIDSQNEEIKIGQNWKSKEDSSVITINKILDDSVLIHSFTDRGLLEYKKKYLLDNYELVLTEKDGLKLNFNEAIYFENERRMVACYFIISETDKYIEIMNVHEFPIKTSIFADYAKPFKIDIKTTKLPKSQVEILKEDPIRKGFFYIDVPYWLYAKDSDNLKIKRIDTDNKRLSLTVNDMFGLAEKLQDPNVEEYFKNGYFEPRTSTKLIPYYRRTSKIKVEQRNKDIEARKRP